MRSLPFSMFPLVIPMGRRYCTTSISTLERGKTYALVGPTGGGKTTTASLMARLYDPTSGTVLLEGKDIRAYSPEERTRKIGFILQEPFLFTGTVRENILYGNEPYQAYSNEQVSGGNSGGQSGRTYWSDLTRGWRHKCRRAGMPLASARNNLLPLCGLCCVTPTC